MWNLKQNCIHSTTRRLDLWSNIFMCCRSIHQTTSSNMANSFWWVLLNSFIFFVWTCFPFLMLCFSILLNVRSERALLSVPGFHHLPQLAAGKAPYVLVGPKPALRQERGGHNGEWCCLTWKIFFRFARTSCAHCRGLSALLPAGICCELPCHHLGENPESFWHICVQSFLGLGYEGTPH